MNATWRCAGRRLGRLLSLAAAGTLVFSPAQVLAQQVESPEAAMLHATSTSDEAAREFWAGLDDFENIFFVRSANHLKKALDLDPNLGLARVMYGWSAPGLPLSERKSVRSTRWLRDARSTGTHLETPGWSAGCFHSCRKLSSRIQ